MAELRCPLPSCSIVPGSGARFGNVAAIGGRIHTGLDLEARTGTPVYAAAAGVVKRTWSEVAGGRILAITHSDRLETRYAHLSRFVAGAGATVAAGQLVAYSGATGLVTGAHLHFEVLVDGAFVDPAPYLGLGAGATVPVGSAPASTDYGPYYPLLESEVAAWARSGSSPCAPGYQLQAVDPKLNYVADNPFGSGPKGAHWFQAPLLNVHPDWVAKLGASPVGADSGLRFACVRTDIQSGNANLQQLGQAASGAAGAAIGAALPVLANLAVVGISVGLAVAGVRRLMQA